MNFNYPAFGGGPVPMPGMAPMAPASPMNGPGYSPSLGTMSMPQSQQTAPAGPQGMISSASRIVGNREEANAVPADFGGNLMLFPDLTHNRVYIKRWNIQTGSADFLEFIPAPPPAPPAPPVPPYDARGDMEALRREVEDLRAEINGLKRSAPAPKGGRKNDTDE